LETGIPSSQDRLDQAVRRTVIARQPAIRRPRPQELRRVLFLIFIIAFLLVVLGMIVQG
jgi:hypothetical protein